MVRLQPLNIVGSEGITEMSAGVQFGDKSFSVTGGAEKSQSDYRGAYGQWPSKMVHETPNYKVWVGSFRSRLEADRALLKIKKKFSKDQTFFHRKNWAFNWYCIGVFRFKNYNAICCYHSKYGNSCLHYSKFCNWFYPLDFSECQNNRCTSLPS